MSDNILPVIEEKSKTRTMNSTMYLTEENQAEMRRMADSHACAVCGSFLTIRRTGPDNRYAVVCSNFVQHNGVKRIEKDWSLINYRRLLKGEPMTMDSKELVKLGVKGMLARVEKARFPQDLKPVEKELLARTAIEYGLDPLFGELILYQGKPYVGIDARRRKAQETGDLIGMDGRPATAEERQERGVEADDYLWRSQAWKKGSEHPFVGWGKVSKKEVDKAVAQAKAHSRQEDSLPIVKDPMQHAEKRADVAALRKGFHLPLPSIEDIIEGEIISVTVEPSEPKKPAIAGGDHPTQAQINKLWTSAKEQGVVASKVNEYIKKTYGVDSAKDLTVAQMSAVIKWVETGEKAETGTAEES